MAVYHVPLEFHYINHNLPGLKSHHIFVPSSIKKKTLLAKLKLVTDIRNFSQRFLSAVTRRAKSRATGNKMKGLVLKAYKPSTVLGLLFFSTIMHAAFMGKMID